MPFFRLTAMTMPRDEYVDITGEEANNVNSGFAPCVVLSFRSLNVLSGKLILKTSDSL